MNVLTSLLGKVAIYLNLNQVLLQLWTPLLLLPSLGCECMKGLFSELATSIRVTNNEIMIEMSDGGVPQTLKGVDPVPRLLTER